jgi:hypothetical protein
VLINRTTCGTYCGEWHPPYYRAGESNVSFTNLVLIARAVEIALSQLLSGLEKSGGSAKRLLRRIQRRAMVWQVLRRTDPD